MPNTNAADITPATYSYEWLDVEQTTLLRTDAAGNIACVPPDPNNRDYADFLSSGATATECIAPTPLPAPPETTTEEKVNRLLSDYGLTRDEMRGALDI